MSLPPPSPFQARTIWLALTGLAVAALVATIGAFVWGLGKVLNALSPVLWPVALGGVLAYILDPLVDFFERKKVSRTRSIVLVFAICAAILLGMLASVVPQMVIEARRLSEDVPEYAHRAQQRITDWMARKPAAMKWIERLVPALAKPDPSARITNAPAATTNQSTLPAQPGTEPPPSDQLLAAKSGENIIKWAAVALPRVGAWIGARLSHVAGLAGTLIALAMAPVFTFYFLHEKAGIQKRWTDYLPVARSGFRDELIFVLKAINDHLIVFFRGQVLVAVCDGICYTIGFLLIGLPYAILLGAMATVLTMIPFLGAIATCATALVIAAVRFGDWQHPLLVLAVFAVVQALEGLVIQPRILGDRVGLHPLTIIIAVLVGTTLLGGLLGGILAIPLTAALKVILTRYVWKERLTTTRSRA
jgi:predicted PurR-regulated permease PerM